jgi:hypothetical protein
VPTRGESATTQEKYREPAPTAPERREVGRVTGHLEGRDVSALSQELTALLVEAGRRMGFDVRTVYMVEGRRLDVVWL